MGPCSSVEQARKPVRRMSFSLIKSDQDSTILKTADQYTEIYDIGSTVCDRDDQVISITNRENEVEYIARSILKSDMPIGQKMGVVERHLLCLRNLDHGHICRFVEAFDDGDNLVLVYEKANSTPLLDIEELPLEEALVQSYTRQIAMALSVAHRNNPPMVHGRLSESSILVSREEDEDSEFRALKICDMGQTFVLRPPRAAGEYEVPEVLWDELKCPESMDVMEDERKAYANTDMWALGVLVYKMLTGRSPFANTKQKDLAEDIKSNTVQFGEEWKAWPDALEAVSGMLKHNSRIRTSADKLLKHAWVAKEREHMSKSKMMRILQNVMFNTTESTFKKFCMRVIAEDMAPETLEIVERAFRRIDKNGDGTLTVEEIGQFLKKCGEQEGVADEIFAAIDRDASGTLNYAEFTAVSIGPQEYCNKETLWHTFNRFDKDNNGSFDKSEITLVLKEVEHLAEAATCEKEVDEIARDIDMPMDFDTFVHTMYTPSGQQVNKLSLGWDKFCHNMLKVDNHNVRSIAPRTYDNATLVASPLMKSPYRKSTLANDSGGMTRQRSSGKKLTK